MNSHLQAPALALCALLAACGGGRVVADTPSSIYSKGEVAYGFAGREARVEVYGDPFPGASRDALESAVTRAMQGRAFGIATTFTTRPQTARDPYRVVVAFNPVQPTIASSACRGPVQTAPAQGGTVETIAALCRGGGAMTSASGWLDVPASPDAPAFRSFVGDLTGALFPLRDPQLDDDDDDGACFFGRC